eukprot:TRINITY_DN2753_c0_g1_i1.p1 TRINITY_DN2753_c0_g1~~TRINITY_DN2753_c0_g1_i1.p1  ORF type:complete len:198 (+),score=46.26 TRINITY_DN2753_c0_g1_i1:340-933(+)
MSLLRYDENIGNLRGALLQIFGNTLIPKDLDIGYEYTVRENYQCVTLDGDVAVVGGAMHGGFNENKYRRLKCYNLMRDLKQESDDMLLRENENERKLKQIESKLLQIDNEIRRNDQQYNLNKDALSEHEERLLELEQDIDVEEERKNKNCKTLEKHQSNINRIETTISGLQNEMKQKLKNKLSEDEEQTLNDLEKEK